jgi:hypothetical protein
MQNSIEDHDLLSLIEDLPMSASIPLEYVFVRLWALAILKYLTAKLFQWQVLIQYQRNSFGFNQYTVVSLALSTFS